MTRSAAAGVPLVDVAALSRLGAGGIRRLRAELSQGGYDILHVFGNRALRNGLLAARGLPVRLVAYRGIVGNVSFFNPVSWMRFLNPRIDCIVCVADAVRDHFLDMRPAMLRLPAARLVTIHKGHSPDWYTEPPADLRAFGIPPDAFVVGCVANYRPRKGIERLVEAMADLPADVHLLLVGRMEARALDGTIAANPAAPRIHRIGYRADAPSLAAACDAAVLPSIRREGLPRSVIEAMACGTAPIVTDAGGNPELVVDGVSGLVVHRTMPARSAARSAGCMTIPRCESGWARPPANAFAPVSGSKTPWNGPWSCTAASCANERMQPAGGVYSNIERYMHVQR